MNNQEQIPRRPSGTALRSIPKKRRLESAASSSVPSSHVSSTKNTSNISSASDSLFSSSTSAMEHVSMVNRPEKIGNVVVRISNVSRLGSPLSQWQKKGRIARSPKIQLRLVVNNRESKESLSVTKEHNKSKIIPNDCKDFDASPPSTTFSNPGSRLKKLKRVKSETTPKEGRKKSDSRSGRATKKKSHGDPGNNFENSSKSENVTSQLSPHRLKKKKDKFLKEKDKSEDEIDFGDDDLPLTGSQNETSPPPGMLNTLWYSQEALLYLSVVDKILGWRNFPSNGPKSVLPNPLPLAEGLRDDRYLIKWRGKSYLHTSWERSVDLYKVDSTAKQKVKRYILLQEQTLGSGWKSILEESQEEEQHFPPEMVEVERIITCDENEMDMNVFANQRKSNRKVMRKQNVGGDETDVSPSVTSNQENDSVKGQDSLAKVMTNKIKTDSGVIQPNSATEWDPEDNVMYACKFKGLPSSDIYWEYWRSIKVNSTDIVEDFWLRQKFHPSIEEDANRPHPHIREFKKLTTSPSFGISFKKRAGCDAVDPESESSFKLRNYQLEGVNWLLWNWWGKRSCILADEMGLGKTIQTVGFLDQLSKMESTKVGGPFLMVAPLTLLQQWNSEVATWAPDFNTVIYHGSADARAFVVQNEFYWNTASVQKSHASRLKKGSITKFNLLLTTYEVVLKDINVLSKIKWKALVVDEAHRLKNTQSRLFRELNLISRDFSLLLTGTPLQNSTEELWALLNFANGDAFSSKETFVEKFGELKQAQQVKDLHSMLKPFLLRRVKEDVEKSLPPKEETILEVTLTPIQKTYYKAIYEKNTSFLFKGSKKSNAPSLMNIMMELRKCCNHPFLIRGIEDRILDEATAISVKKTSETPDPTLIFTEQLVKSSGKMVILDKLLPKLKQGGHKVLIFSQMVRCLDILQEFLRIHEYKFERLDGSTGAGARAAAVDRFNNPNYNRFVMLLSTRAGGLGLNLTSADTVIIFDSDWNPQNDLQAMARAHRIGQTRAVHVYRILTKKTYEMHMFHQASLKLGLDRAVLAHQRQEEGEGNSSKMSQLDQANEIDQLLKKGAYDVFRDEDDSESQKFMETDIDELMARSSHKVTYGADSGKFSSGLGSFSKASFVSTDNTEDIDLNDPDFWQKAIGLDAPPEGADDETSLLLAGLENKRSRKQVQVFDPYEAEKKIQEKKEVAAQVEKEAKAASKAERKKRKSEDRHRKKKKSKTSAARLDGIFGLSKKKKHRSHDKKGKERKSSRFSHEEPIIEKVKQIWDSNMRNKIIQAILKYGFNRFCKVRHQIGLPSMAIQDIEIFCRALIFQLGISCAVPILAKLHRAEENSKDIDAEALLQPFINLPVGEWLGNAMLCALQIREKILDGKCFLRLPRTLMDSSFVTKLQSGTARRFLQRSGFLSQVNSLVEGILDEVLLGLGSEDLGKRGCPKDLSSLDVDLKFYYVTIEEVFHGFSQMSERHSRYFAKRGLPHLSWANPVEWWDNDCDIGLIIGTFLHGFGNYENMKTDSQLPFASKIASFARQNTTYTKSYEAFVNSVSSAKSFYKDGKIKIPDSLNGTPNGILKGDSSLCREGSSSSPGKGTSDIISLHHLAYAIQDVKEKVPVSTAEKQTNEQDNVLEDCNTLYNEKKYSSSSLPMPDAKVLDRLLSWLVHSYESSKFGKDPSFSCCYIFCEEDTFKKNLHLKNKLTNDSNSTTESIIEYNQNFVRRKLEMNTLDESYLYSPLECAPEDSYINIGLDGSKIACKDQSDYSADLSLGIDLSHMERGAGVPSAMTRFGLSSLLLASNDVIQKVEVDPSGKSKDGVWKGVKERTAFCALILKHGDFSCAELDKGDKLVSAITSDVLAALHMSTSESNGSQNICKSVPFFSANDLAQLMNKEGKVEQTRNLMKYFQDVLLPHCLRLCLQGARGKRNLKSENCDNDDLSNIAAIHDLYLHTGLSPLPDPFIQISRHSDGAVTRALAILRRARLMKCVKYIVGGGLPICKITAFLKSKFMKRSLYGLPVWWCPWIHDLALLVGTAKCGLLSIDEMQTPDLGIDQITKVSIAKHIRKVFVNEKKLPSHMNENTTSVNEWIQRESCKFPSALTVERRISIICSKLSEMYLRKLKNVCYTEIPFFDQGAWPAKIA